MNHWIYQTVGSVCWTGLLDQVLKLNSWISILDGSLSLIRLFHESGDTRNSEYRATCYGMSERKLKIRVRTQAEYIQRVKSEMEFELDSELNSTFDLRVSLM